MEENKSNQSQVSGDHNIVIQDVSANNITLNVNGKEAKLEIAMNQWLVQQVMPKISTHNEIAGKFMKAVAQVNDWQNQPKYRNAGLTILQSSYIGVVGIYLKKLSAISGAYSFSAEKLKEYIKNSYFLSIRLLDLVNVVLISALWDAAKKNELTLQDTEKSVINQFFAQTVERDIQFSFELFVAIYKVFEENALPFPIKELADLKPQAQTESALHQAFVKVETVFNDIQKQEPKGEESFWLEKSITDILSQFHFLAKYKIQSVKEVDYHHIRSLEEHFIHKLNFYGLSSKLTEQENLSAEKVQYSTEKINTDSVILYETDYFSGINLFPFIVDHNTVFLEQGTNLCVFSHLEIADDNHLNYISIADNDYLGIQSQKQPAEQNLNEVYADKNNIVQHKKNTVYQLLFDAQKAIIGNDNDDADSFLDELLG